MTPDYIVNVRRAPGSAKVGPPLIGLDAALRKTDITAIHAAERNKGFRLVNQLFVASPWDGETEPSRQIVALSAKHGGSSWL